MDMDEEEELFEGNFMIISCLLVISYQKYPDALNDDEEEELALPSILAGISVADKKKLLQFKRNHTEVNGVGLLASICG